MFSDMGVEFDKSMAVITIALSAILTSLRCKLVILASAFVKPKKEPSLGRKNYYYYFRCQYVFDVPVFVAL